MDAFCQPLVTIANVYRSRVSLVVGFRSLGWPNSCLLSLFWKFHFYYDRFKRMIEYIPGKLYRCGPVGGDVSTPTSFNTPPPHTRTSKCAILKFETSALRIDRLTDSDGKNLSESCVSAALKGKTFPLTAHIHSQRIKHNMYIYHTVSFDPTCW